MVYFLSILLALLIPIQSVATYLPETDSLTVAGRKLTQISKLKTFGIRTNGTQHSTFREFNDTSGTGYQVPTGKKLVILALRIEVSSSGTDGCTMGYGDTAVFESASAPTSAVYALNSGTSDRFLMQTPASAVKELAVYFEVPAGKYPFVYCFTNKVFQQAYAYLEDV